MKIWLINNYNMLPEHGHLNRNYYLAKYLKRHGHEPICFVGSHPHNTQLQLIEGSISYKVFQEDPFPWVLIKTRNYEGSKASRVISMFEFYFNMLIAARNFDRPDAIVGSSAHPLAALLAIKLGEKYGCKKVVEIRDLWPESIVAYGVLSKHNPIVKILRKLEKWLYKHSDCILFTMPGGYKYICDQGWDNVIPKDKVYHLSNGIDLEQFQENQLNNQFKDPDLDDPNTFKFIYTGSLRSANQQIVALIDAIELMQSQRYKDFRFLIYGKGGLEQELKNKCISKGISNVVFKGFVEKKYIPYILSKCNACILNIKPNEVLKYGGSQNKLFDYLASGNPIVSGESSEYSIVNKYNCGISQTYKSPRDVVNAFEMIKETNYDKQNIINIAKNFSYEELAFKMDNILERI